MILAKDSPLTVHLVGQSVQNPASVGAISSLIFLYAELCLEEYLRSLDISNTVSKASRCYEWYPDRPDLEHVRNNVDKLHGKMVIHVISM